MQPSLVSLPWRRERERKRERKREKVKKTITTQDWNEFFFRGKRTILTHRYWKRKKILQCTFHTTAEDACKKLLSFEPPLFCKRTVKQCQVTLQTHSFVRAFALTKGKQPSLFPPSLLLLRGAASFFFGASRKRTNPSKPAQARARRGLYNMPFISPCSKAHFSSSFTGTSVCVL